MGCLRGAGGGMLAAMRLTSLVTALIALLPPGPLRAQDARTLTDSLVHAFGAVWNANDLDGMVGMLREDAFFESPYQLRYGRDTMAATVLRTNPPVFRDCASREDRSRVVGDVAWSLGELYCSRYYPSGAIHVKVIREDGDGFLGEEYDEAGRSTGRRRYDAIHYTYVFRRGERGEWKVQMLIYHEPGG